MRGDGPGARRARSGHPGTGDQARDRWRDDDPPGRDRAATGRVVGAVREGFTALARHGIWPTPRPLRFIFTTAPRPLAVSYWCRQFRGPTGTETIAPHVRATRHSELPPLMAAVRDLVGTSAPTLERLLRDAAERHPE